MQDEQTTTNSEETTNSASSETTTNETSGSNTSTTEQATDQQDKIDLGKPSEKAEDGEDDQTDDSKDSDSDDDDGETAALFGAPEEDAAYEIEGLPEGMSVDEEALKAFDPVARQLNLSNTGMSLIAKTYAEQVLPKVMEQFTGQINADVVAQRKTWEDEARDAISGKGDALKNAAGETLAFDTKELSKVQQIAAKSLDKLAPEGFREWLDETGLGVHPMMISFAYQAGKLIAEDTELETADKGSRTPSRTQKYYGR